MMIVIADSGSTKTEWAFVRPDKTVDIKHTIGLNPLFIDSPTIADTLTADFKEMPVNEVEKVYFFGASCSSEARCGVVEKGLKAVFPKADFFLEHDMLGAAVSLFGNRQGLAVIFGTGSNSALYDGKQIIENIPALGYILGDEGSGAYFGLQLAKSFLNGTMPSDLRLAFSESFKQDKDAIFNHLYQQAFPNRYLASFAPFLSEHKQHPFVHQLLIDGFDAFFKLHILPYSDYHRYPLGSIGSIGFYFSDELQEVAQKYGVVFSKIHRSPMEGLIQQYAV